MGPPGAKPKAWKALETPRSAGIVSCSAAMAYLRMVSGGKSSPSSAAPRVLKQPAWHAAAADIDDHMQREVSALGGTQRVLMAQLQVLFGAVANSSGLTVAGLGATGVAANLTLSLAAGRTWWAPSTGSATFSSRAA